MPHYFGMFVLLMGALSLGCTSFEHPLAPPEKGEIDQEVFGSWYSQQENIDGTPTQLFLHIGPPNENLEQDVNHFPPKDERTAETISADNLTRIVFVEVNSEGKVNTLSFLSYTVRLGEHRYAHIPQLEKGKPKQYSIWKYQVDGDKLSAWLRLSSAVLELKDSGQLHGIDSSEEMVKHEVITDETDALRKVFVEHDAELFPKREAIVFRRLKVK